MNNVTLMGRLTRDPDIRHTNGANGEMAVARFTLAINRRFKRDEADFINCVAFGKTAETIEKYVNKGRMLAVQGEWRTGSYENKEGKKVYTNDCNVSAIYFCDSASNSDADANKSVDDFMQIPDTDMEALPFN